MLSRLTTWARDWAQAPTRIARMEQHMATAAEQINALTAKVDDLVNDVRAALSPLGAERENLTADGQAALDTLTAKVDAFDVEVGDADGSDSPPTEPGTDTFR